LANIRAQRDHLLTSASRLMRRGIFGHHGYGLDGQGSEESVTQLQAADLRQFYDQWVRPNNCVLAVYGDVQAEAVRSAVDAALGAWQPRPGLLQTDGSLPAIAQRQHSVEHRDKKQAVLVIGFPGVSLHNPDRYALELVQEALSDLGSRLFLRIRENLGLAYYVGAQSFLGLRPGYFALYAGTTPEKASLVEFELLKEAESLRVGGLTETELQRAKAKLIGQKKIARQDLGAYAMTTALDELYGLGYQSCDTEDARYEAITMEEVQTVARRYLNPDACIVATVCPPAGGVPSNDPA
jgi:zinc protease